MASSLPRFRGTSIIKTYAPDQNQAAHAAQDIFTIDQLAELFGVTSEGSEISPVEKRK